MTCEEHLLKILNKVALLWHRLKGRNKVAHIGLPRGGFRPGDGAKSTRWSGPVERRDGGAASVVNLDFFWFWGRAIRLTRTARKKEAGGTHYSMGREEADWSVKRVKDKRVGAHNVKAVAGVV